MKLHVLSGDDQGGVAARRRELIDQAIAAGALRDDVDVADDGGAALVNAAASPGLFAPVRVIAAENIDQISDEHLTRLAALADVSDAVIVARTGATITAARRKKFPPAEFETLSVPKGAGLAGSVTALFERARIKLDRAGRELVAARALDDMDRVRSVVAQLQMAEIDAPTARQLDVLLGRSSESGVPWQITDALDRDDAAGAVAAARTAEPIPTIAYLRSRVDMAARALECGARNADELAAALGTKPYSARQAAALGRRLGPDRLRQAALVMRDAELDARSAVGADAALDVAVAKLASLWNAGR